MAAFYAGDDKHGREYYKDEVGRLEKRIEKERRYKYERKFTIQREDFVAFLSSHAVKKRDGDQQKFYNIRYGKCGRP